MLFRLVTLHHCLYWSQLNQLRCLGSSVGRVPIYTELWSAWVHKISCIDTVYMQHEAILGLVRSYVSLAGDITIPDGVILTVDSDLNGASPQFTLTCIHWWTSYHCHLDQKLSGSRWINCIGRCEDSTVLP